MRGAPHQLLDEGGADASGPSDCLVDQGFVEPQTLAIELNQLPSANVIRQRNLDRLIDPARSVGQCALELFGPVGGEDKQDVRILFQSVHLVEKHVEHGTSSQGPIISRSVAMRSTSSMTTMAGCNRRARFV